jgi:hypothetical protein
MTTRICRDRDGDLWAFTDDGAAFLRDSDGTWTGPLLPNEAAVRLLWGPLHPINATEHARQVEHVAAMAKLTASGAYVPCDECETTGRNCPAHRAHRTHRTPPGQPMPDPAADAPLSTHVRALIQELDGAPTDAPTDLDRLADRLMRLALLVEELAQNAEAVHHPPAPKETPHA